MGAGPREEAKEKGEEVIKQLRKEQTDVSRRLEEVDREVWDEYHDLCFLSLDALEPAAAPADLVASDNVQVRKLVAAWGQVEAEAVRLVGLGSQLFKPFAAFGERFQDLPMDEGEEVSSIAGLLPAMERLALFAARAHALVSNALSQLAGMYTDAKGTMYRATLKGVHLHHALGQLGELVRVLITLDEVIGSNTELQVQWTEYKRMLQSAALEPEVFGLGPKRAAKLLMAVMRLEADLFNGAILRGCWMQETLWYHDSQVKEARSNKTFLDEMTLALREITNDVTARIGDATESDHRLQLVGVCGLFVLFSQLNRGRELDSKLYKTLMGLKTKIPMVFLYGRAVWDLQDFLQTCLPASVGKPGKDARLSFVSSHDDSLTGSTLHLIAQVSAWMVRMESAFSSKVKLDEILSTRGNLLIHGVLLAYQVNNVGCLSLAMHLKTGTPIRQSNLRPLHQCIHMLKAIQFTYFRKSELISSFGFHIHRYLQQRLLQILEPIQSDLETQLATSKKSGWRSEDSKADMCAMIQIMTDNLRGPNTAARRAVINAAWNMLPKKQIREGDVEDVKLLLRKLDILGELPKHLAQACDCSFLLWSRGLLPLFLADIKGRWKECNQLHLLMAAVMDMGAVLEHSVDAEQVDGQENQNFSSFRQFILDSLEWELIRPLCEQIETDLRLHIHSSQIEQMSKSNPLRDGVQDLAAFLQIKPLRILGQIVDIKAKVTDYLDRTFYNLTTVATHDWKTYAEMRNLAQEKYGIFLIDSQLPTGTLEQGLDVLEIMRNIHIFVSRYNYHLHTQVFVERPADNKYISTIGIQQIASSIRTHGMGIMNTTVNYTYQFLARKFAVFSQFLFDDHIKSRLVKDVRYFRENRDALGSRYSYDRALNFNAEIRRLGVDSENKSYLDKFRQLVTEIGNALGFVRLIRAGGLHYVSKAVDFIPDLQAVDAERADGGDGKMNLFSNAVEGEGLSSETTEAAANLDSAISDLTHKFAEGTDFFKLLVDVFSQQLCGTEQSHLRNFFIIVPPLTINFVEHMLTVKDKLLKGKRQVGGAFCDDGFSLGIAFILRVLGQKEQFDSLHWFEAVNVKLKDDGLNLDQERNQKSRISDEQLQTLQLALSRLRARQVENDLVYFTLRGASVFFKS